jgi:integrase
VSRRTFGTIRRLPSGRWRARFTDHNGRQKAAPQTFTTKAEAGRWLSRTQSEMERGQFVDPKVGKELLSDYAALWLSTRLVRGRPLSPRTLELYRWQLRKHILPALGKTQLRHLGTTEVRGWFARINGPDGPGQPTAAKCSRLLRAIMQTATEDGRVAKNPCSIRSAGREESVERPMITLEQLDAITAAVGERWRSLIDMAAWCGLRFGELAALRKSRIDLDTETVMVAESVAVLAGGSAPRRPPKV